MGTGPNPSNLRIEDDCSDDDIKVNWFGVFKEKKLVAVSCMTLSELEVSRYLSAKKNKP